jgi:hypothetical protein
VLDLGGDAEQEDDIVAAVELRGDVDPDGVGGTGAEERSARGQDAGQFQRVVERWWLGGPRCGGEHGTQMPADASAHGFPRMRRRPRQTGEEAAKLAQHVTPRNPFVSRRPATRR